MKFPLALSAVSAAVVAAFPAFAQTSAPQQLDPVVVTAERTRQSSFDAPAAISVVGRDVIDSAGPQVNVSEVLDRVPGITVLNRQNYAQDLQLSIRGFGARSTFGIRGVRLIVDGIPATMPDGQGQASNIALSSVGRVEVLRGPMAQLYGNAAGGVVQFFTEDDAAQPTVWLSAAGGPYGLWKAGSKFSTTTASGVGVLVDASHFVTDGYRDHSAAQRGQLNARVQTDLGRDTSLSLLLNALDQPVSQDPIGLNRAQFEADPRRVAQPAIDQNSRKSVRQQQLGSVLEHRFSDATTLTARVYAGNRDLDNALSVAPSAQTAPTSSGGIVQFARTYAGAGLQLAHRIALDEGRALRLTGGLEIDRMREDRQGYVNDAGNATELKRNELNTVRNDDVYAQAAFDLSPQWTLIGGLRSSHVKFDSADRFVTAKNPDDSGAFSYHATNPVIGVSWKATPDLNVYANLGRGFETPTFTEVAYRSDGQTGLNSDLHASHSRHAEVGAKWKLAPGHRLDAAIFDIHTDDEIVVASNSSGRSVFKNAGRTSRRGVELSYLGDLSESLRATVSLTALRARYLDTFDSLRGTVPITVPAGNALPGTPNRNAFAELAWAPKAAWGGFNAAVEVVHTGRIYVNDLNDDAAAAVTVLNLRAGLAQQAGAWRFSELIRVDNVTDKRYAGSVIVNEGTSAAFGGGRYFEPALPRTWLLGVTGRYTF